MHGTFEVSEVVTRDPSITPAAQERARREQDEARGGRPEPVAPFVREEPDYTETRVVLYPHAGDKDDVAIGPSGRYLELILPTDDVEDLVPGAVVEMTLRFKVLPPPSEGEEGETRNAGNAPVHSAVHADAVVAGRKRAAGEVTQEPSAPVASVHKDAISASEGSPSGPVAAAAHADEGSEHTGHQPTPAKATKAKATKAPARATTKVPPAKR
jgi:hypothetical protein